MNIDLETFEYITQNPNAALYSALRDMAAKSGVYGDRLLVTPRAIYDKIPQFDGDNVAQAMEDVETLLLRSLPFIRLSETKEEDITKEFVVVPASRYKMIQAMFSRPEYSFIKTPLNAAAWMRNKEYRSNVNFEGYAHWNAALFFHVARNRTGMAADDINLVLRVVSFNNSPKLRAFFAPADHKDKPHFSLLSSADYVDLLIAMCYDLQKTIKRHRERTGRRYSARDVTPRGADKHSAEIGASIREICAEYQEKAIKLGRKK